MKEVKKKKGILDDNTVITIGNIEKLSQCFAQSALKSIKKYAYSATSKIERLQSLLRQDICYHKKLDAYCLRFSTRSKFVSLQIYWTQTWRTLHKFKVQIW